MRAKKSVTGEKKKIVRLLQTFCLKNKNRMTNDAFFIIFLRRIIQNDQERCKSTSFLALKGLCGWDISNLILIPGRVLNVPAIDSMNVS